jgi:hypothetical protein
VRHRAAARALGRGQQGQLRPQRLRLCLRLAQPAGGLHGTQRGHGVAAARQGGMRRGVHTRARSSWRPAPGHGRDRQPRVTGALSCCMHRVSVAIMRQRCRAQVLTVELVDAPASPADAAAPCAERRGETVSIVAASGLHVAVSAPPAGGAGDAGPATAALRGAPGPRRAHGAGRSCSTLRLHGMYC